MKEEKRVCGNCGKKFLVEEDDFGFYERIGVPAPTWCPECRMVRRMLFRNERSLYRRKCDSCGKGIVSMFNEDFKAPVYCPKCWWSDEWDALEYGKDLDFSKNFLEEFARLYQSVPSNNLISENNQNCDYVNWLLESKNCYLVFGGKRGENVLYSWRVVESKDSSDLYSADDLELCYEDVICRKSYQLMFSYECEGCSDSKFLFDCKNCSDCFGCVGLRGKQHHIFNIPYSKDQYEKEMERIDCGSFEKLENYKKKFREFNLKFPRKFASLTRTESVTGDHVFDAKNCSSVFDILAGGAENNKFVFRGGYGSKDVYDAIVGSIGVEQLYEVVSTLSSSQVLFSVAIWSCNDIQYSYNCHSCSHCFGCAGLRNREYCILNRQYSKEEYEKLVPQIKKHMDEMPYQDKEGRVYKYGEFFPPEMSPFAYNETIAQEYFPLSKSDAESQKHNWKDFGAKNYQPTVFPENLPDHINDVEDSITEEIIACKHQGACHHQCTTAFKVTPSELSFYRRMNLPLPRLCPNCRHYERLAQRNPLKLWKRTCQCNGEKSQNKAYKNTNIHRNHGNSSCSNEFETSYSPKRQEIVYCEECYNREVT